MKKSGTKQNKINKNTRPLDACGSKTKNVARKGGFGPT